MKLSLFALSLAFLIPTVGSSIELEAERECRDRLWNSRLGALVTMDVAHPVVGRSALTGILEQVEGGHLDFGNFLIKDSQVIESSVVLPKKGDLITMNVWLDGHISSQLTIFDRVERGLLYGKSMSVPVSHLTGGLRVVEPGTYVYVEYYRPGPGDLENRKAMGFFTLKGVSQSTLDFGYGLVLPLSDVRHLQIARP